MKKLVVITGASSGFGLEMAKLFSDAGHPTLLLSKSNIKELEALNLKNSILASVDVTDYSTLQKAISDAESIYGKTDLLINNAGVMLLGNLHNQAPEEWQK